MEGAGRQQPGQAAQRRQGRKIEHRAPFGLAQFAQAPHVEIDDAGNDAGAEAECRAQRLITGKRGLQQEYDADETRRQYGIKAAAHRFLEPRCQQQRQKQGRSVVQGHRCRQRQPAHEDVGTDQQGGDEAAPEHQFRGRELCGAKLDAYAHAGEQQARCDHPE